MNKNKGFTLIELLVVIAIIGILSSVVLASLNGARTKAKVAAVQSTLSSMRSQAEIGVVNGRYANNICQSTSVGGLDSLIKSINKTSAKIQNLGCGQDTAKETTTPDVSIANRPRAWAVEVEIDSKWYCTDSSGFSGPSGGTTPGAASTLVLTNRSTTFGAAGAQAPENFGVTAANLSCN